MVQNRHKLCGESASIKNWAGNLTYHSATCVIPQSVDEIQASVENSASVKALGSRHSFNTIADTTGIQISLEAFQSISEVDISEKTVTIGSGVTYGQLAPILDAQGFALRNLASLPHISVAGAVATGTHGSGIKNSSLSAAVREVKFINGRGDLAHLKKGDPEFDGAIVAMGALGVVTSLTLEVVPTFTVAQKVYLDLPFSSAVRNFDHILSAGYSVSLFTDWKESRFNQVWLKDIGSRQWEHDLFGARFATEKMHPVPGMPAENTTDQFNQPGPWFQKLPHFKLEFTPSSGVELQTEYLVPKDQAVSAFIALREIADQISPLLFVSEVRTIAADDLWMSPAYKRDSVAFHFTWKQLSSEVAALLPAIESKLAPFEARPHWGKLFAMRADRLRTIYPEFEAFRELCKKHDPERKFNNAFLAQAIYAA